MFRVLNAFSLTVGFDRKPVEESHATLYEFSLRNQYRVHFPVQNVETFELTFCYSAGTNASTESMSSVRNWPRMNAKVSSFSFLMNFMHSY